MKLLFLLVSAFAFSIFIESGVDMKLTKSVTIDSLGACQGVSIQHGKALLYGDREVGIIRQFSFDHDTLVSI